MKYQDFVPFYQKLNYKCKSGTVDDSNKCEIENNQPDSIITDSHYSVLPTSTKTVLEKLIHLDDKNIENNIVFKDNKIIGQYVGENASVDLPIKIKQELSGNFGKYDIAHNHPDNIDTVLVPSGGDIKLAMERGGTQYVVTSDYIYKYKFDNKENIPDIPDKWRYWSKDPAKRNLDRVSSDINAKWTEIGLNIKYLNKKFPNNKAFSSKEQRTEIAHKALISFAKKIGMQYERFSVNKQTKSKQNSTVIDQNSAHIKLNFRCPKGTVDDTFSCGKTPEEAKKNYEKLQKEKAPTKIPEKSVPAQMDAKDIIRRVQSGGKITLEEISKRKSTKQNSTPVKLSMKHPGNWSTADSLDTKIKKELESGVQDVLDVLKSVGYFKEDPKEVALNEAYQKIAQEIFDAHVKLNINCKEEEKVGSGPGSCSGGNSKIEQKSKLTAAKNDVKKYRQEYKEYVTQLKKVSKESSEYYEILRKRNKAMENKEASEKLVRTYSYVHPERTKEISPLLDQSNAIIENASEHEQVVLAQYVFGAGNSTYQKILSDHNGNIPNADELATEWANEKYGHYDKKDISEGGFYYDDYMNYKSSDKKSAEEIIRVITLQNAIVDRSITPNNIKVYTGISSRHYSQLELNPGTEFQINQLTSTSRDPTIAIGFSLNKSNEEHKQIREAARQRYGKHEKEDTIIPTYLEINLQQGSRALALEDFALKENGPDATWIVGSSGKKGMGSQQEVLVGRKLQCTIKEIVNEGNIRKIVVDAKTAELK